MSLITDNEIIKLQAQLGDALQLIAKLKEDLRITQNESIARGMTVIAQEEQIERLQAQVRFIEDGLPDAMALEEHYVWASAELTRRRAFEKGDICRIIGDLKAKLDRRDRNARIAELETRVRELESVVQPS